jgi:hypothetical protein
MESEHLFFVLIKYMCCEASMCPEPLSSNSSANSLVVFGHVADVVSLRVHNHVAVRLFETTK